MTTDDATVTNCYNKDVRQRLDLEFIDLTHTGSADSRCNQVLIVTVPDSFVSSIRSTYRSRDPHGIKDFEKVSNDDGTSDLYFGSSYGAGQLLGAVGTVLYYAEIFS